MDAPRQLPFQEEPMAPVEPMSDPGADHGEVFTRRWVVELILDLVGYTTERDLAQTLIVEPSCGTGAFLGPIVDRLVASSVGYGRDVRSIRGAIRAFDVLAANAEQARKVVALRLLEAGVTDEEASDIARAWVTTGDFLLRDHEARSADFVVGNPPYVRLESVFRPTMDAYRRACPTMRGRSDLYIGFIERGLDLLRPGGTLGFICADRWMRNQYGAGLRALISRSYAVEAVVSMHDVDAFEHDVSAYPAIIVLRDGPKRDTIVAEATSSFGENDATRIAAWARRRGSRAMTTPTIDASKVDGWFEGADLWPSCSPAQFAILADLEARFPPLQDPRTGTRVGIGLATGCDDVYVTNDPDIVEEDRLLPLLRAGDTTSGVANWSGSYLVNPWDPEGLVDLRRFPRLARYLESHRTRLSRRHVARRLPAQWYRTIDRTDAELLARPKLVIPDLKAASHPVLDQGHYYPHHNLYFVVSDSWDLEVLGGLLLSDVTNLFVGAYCVRMRGGCYRFQAQYLRRVRVPGWQAVSPGDRRALASAFAVRDVEAATAVALRLYGLEGLPKVVSIKERRLR
jgi:adenine-specific DNA-methyltransferase